MREAWREAHKGKSSCFIAARKLVGVAVPRTQSENASTRGGEELERGIKNRLEE